ncbi:MAG TPA: SpoIIE family protein phosphatase [Verrucomicrobiae bacterium]
MTDRRTLCFPVADSSQVGGARRAAAQLAARIGLDENSAGRAAILTTELANNLHKHARDGSILMHSLDEPHRGLELIAIDKGPGMDVARCMRDGYSTSGTPGTGLGSVVRMADLWDVYSVEGMGTAVLARIHAKSSAERRRKLSLGAICLPLKGETRCGDNWSHLSTSTGERVLVVDGIGHGTLASDAAETAATTFERARAVPLSGTIRSIHEALKNTRGAAIAIAEIDIERGILRYVGVGNIAAQVLHAGTSRSLVSHNGTMGHEIRKVQEFQYPWPAGALLVMTSDGLTTRWDLKKYPGLAQRPPSLLASVLWRDFARGRDDATVVVAREETAA